MVRSFDPGQLGWLSVGQIRRAYSTLGLIPEETLEERTPIDKVLKGLLSAQEKELYYLLNTGIKKEENYVETNTSSST